MAEGPRRGGSGTVKESQGESIRSIGVSDTVTEPTDETWLVVLAELLADLPEADRRELIADLPASDRVAIARRLIGSGEQKANPREGQ
jgi:hypothetical protein